MNTSEPVLPDIPIYQQVESDNAISALILWCMCVFIIFFVFVGAVYQLNKNDGCFTCPQFHQRHHQSCSACVYELQSV
jgi:hypothetical protein